MGTITRFRFRTGESSMISLKFFGSVLPAEGSKMALVGDAFLENPDRLEEMEIFPVLLGT